MEVIATTNTGNELMLQFDENNKIVGLYIYRQDWNIQYLESIGIMFFEGTNSLYIHVNESDILGFLSIIVEKFYIEKEELNQQQIDYLLERYNNFVLF